MTNAGTVFKVNANTGVLTTLVELQGMGGLIRERNREPA
jgi:hypothetical protein